MQLDTNYEIMKILYEENKKSHRFDNLMYVYCVNEVLKFLESLHNDLQLLAKLIKERVQTHAKFSDDLLKNCWEKIDFSYIYDEKNLNEDKEVGDLIKKIDNSYWFDVKPVLSRGFSLKDGTCVKFIYKIELRKNIEKNFDSLDAEPDNYIKFLSYLKFLKMNFSDLLDSRESDFRYRYIDSLFVWENDGSTYFDINFDWKKLFPKDSQQLTIPYENTRILFSVDDGSLHDKCYILEQVLKEDLSYFEDKYDERLKDLTEKSLKCFKYNFDDGIKCLVDERNLRLSLTEKHLTEDIEEKHKTLIDYQETIHDIESNKEKLEKYPSVVEELEKIKKENEELKTKISLLTKTIEDISKISKI